MRQFKQVLDDSLRRPGRKIATAVADADLLIYVLGCMFGIGDLRTVEQIKGATK